MKRLALLLSLSYWLCGCSWIFLKPLPHDYRPGQRVDCTTSVGAPIADTLLAVSDIPGVVYAAETSNDKTSSATNAVVAGALIWTAIYLGSAIHGYSATAACREAMASDAGRPLYPRTRVRPSTAAPPPVVPPPPGPVQQQDNDDPDRPHPPKPAPTLPAMSLLTD